MDTTPSDRTGVLIVRLWIEDDHPTRLRARITQTLEDTSREKTIAAASTNEDICAIVKRWVETFADPGAPTVTPP